MYQQVTLLSEVNIVYSSFKSEWLLTGLPQDDLLMNHLWAFIPQKSRWWLLLRNKRQLRSKVDTWGSDWIALWMHNFVYFSLCLSLFGLNLQWKLKQQDRIYTLYLYILADSTTAFPVSDLTTAGSAACERVKQTNVHQWVG